MNIRICGRSKGQSAIAASAFRSGEKLKDYRDDNIVLIEINMKCIAFTFWMVEGTVRNFTVLKYKFNIFVVMR